MPGYKYMAGACAEWQRIYKPNHHRERHIMEFLKETLGDELYTQVSEKMKDSKIKLADLSGGAYVGKDKFDALSAERPG